MDTVSELYYWTNHVLFYALIALRVWAFVDCVIRKPAAFTAVDKLTKPACKQLRSRKGGKLTITAVTAGSTLGPATRTAKVKGRKKRR